LVAGRAGAGIFASSGRLSQSIALGSYTTVFQAEVYAILVCGLVLLSDPKRGGKTVICSDSKAAIRAIEADEVRYKLVMECKSTLEVLSRGGGVYLAWVPGHTGVSGNMKADLPALELGNRFQDLNLVWGSPIARRSAQ